MEKNVMYMNLICFTVSGNALTGTKKTMTVVYECILSMLVMIVFVLCVSKQ